MTLFLIEFASAISNEHYDYETDKINKNYSQFTGRSRMIVNERITFKLARNAIFISYFAYSLVIILTLRYNNYAFFILSIGALLGLAYTIPPLNYHIEV
jgi:4-hydroxybenzoate polyprenyltransferase